MASNVTNIYTGQPLASGVVFVAPLGTTAPTSATSTLGVAWVDLGYAGRDGFVEKNDRKIDYKRSFGGKVVKVLQTEYNSMIEFTLLESVNANVLKAVFGAGNVTVTPATTQHGTQIQVNKNAIKLPHQSWVIDSYDSESGAKYRNYIADGKIITVADIKLASTDTIEYKIMVEAFETVRGNDNIVTFTDDGVVSGS
jgi:hypothetical protein